jgi:hypothetical protein
LNKIKTQLPAIKAAVKIKLPLKPEAHAATEGNRAKKMWEENRNWWEAIAMLSDEMKILTIFWVYDLYGSNESAFLEQALGQIAKEKSYATVIRLGPECFGIDPKTTVEQLGHVINDLTLDRDPHANPRQHELIGLALFDYLKNFTEVLAKLKG